MTSRYLLSLVLALNCALESQAEQRTAREWLDAMNGAFRDLNYDGIFSYYGGSDLTSLRIVHVVVNGVERERLVHLNGAPREIIRKGQSVACILQPGDDILELESSIPAGPFAQAFSRRFDAVAEHYEIAAYGTGRIAGRPAVRIGVSARDEDRYGFRLWLDEGTGLLLRSELLDTDGSQLEVFQFTHLVVGDVDVGAVESESVDGSAVVSHLELDETPLVAQTSVPWHAAWVPRGFVMSSADIRRNSSRKAVNTLMYTDGLAAFSIFIESMPKQGAGMMESRAGGTVVVTDTAEDRDGLDYLVTVVGEVPLMTARKVAGAIAYRTRP